MMVYRDAHLAHWGIKDMKWYQRRYQNPDGTLTEEGKKRYRKQSNRIEDMLDAKTDYAETIAKLDKVRNATLYDSGGKLTKDAYRYSDLWSAKDKENYFEADGVTLNEAGKRRLERDRDAAVDKYEEKSKKYKSTIRDGEAAIDELPDIYGQEIAREYELKSKALTTTAGALNNAADSIRESGKREAAKEKMLYLTEFTTQELKERIDRRTWEQKYDDMFNEKKAEIIAGKEKSAEFIEKIAVGLGLTATALQIANLVKQISD